eukprot:TRINITY_DN12049_c0_g1_i1.p1 TRINITY_DN12049_c0_g1~~TRINITY_DN12049_c0_g1_i1.p1  ORF type:complete len:622 (+),score=75.28 TRINITY_DN12049_c0_g1_i1:64-1866(+)
MTDSSAVLQDFGYPLTARAIHVLDCEVRPISVELESAVRLATALNKLSTTRLVEKLNDLLQQRPFVSGIACGLCDVVMYEKLTSLRDEIPTIRWSSRGNKHHVIRQWQTLMTSCPLLSPIGNTYRISSLGTHSVVDAVGGADCSYFRHLKKFTVLNLPATNPTITVLTYNTLSSGAFLRYESENRDEDKKNMSERIYSLIRTVLSFDADAVLLSEVDVMDYKNYWKKCLSDSVYKFFYYARPMFHGNNNPDGLLLMWKTTVLSKLFVEKINLDSYAEATIACGLVDGATRNISIIGCFTHLPSQTNIIVAGSHLYWKPSCSKYKLFQASVTRKEICRLARHRDVKHIFYCGDFNMPAGSTEQSQIMSGEALYFSCKGEVVLPRKSTVDQLKCRLPEKASLQLKKLLEKKYLRLVEIIVTAKENIHSGAIDSVTVTAQDDSIVEKFTGPVHKIKLPENQVFQNSFTDIIISLHPMIQHDISEYTRNLSVEFNFQKDADTPLESAYSSYSSFKKQIPDHLVAEAKDLYSEIDFETNEPRFTNYNTKSNPPFMGTLDYIFHTSNLRVRSLVELPDYVDTKNLGIPSEISPADHFPLWAEFEFL